MSPTQSPKPPARRLPAVAWMLAWVSLLNEISAQMVAPLIPVLLAGVLGAGPVALGLVEGTASAVAAWFKLWSGRVADAHPARRKTLVLLGYGLALAARPLMALATHWGVVVALRGADRFGKGLRGAPRDAMLADATPAEQQGRAYVLNRAMDYAGAVVGSLVAAAALSYAGLSLAQVILASALPGAALLLVLARLPSTTATPTPAQAPAPRTVSAPLLGRWAELPARLRRYVTMLAVYGLATASESFIVLRGHELGQSTVMLLMLWAWLATLQSGVAMVAAPLADRLPKARLTALNWVGLALGYGALAAIGSVTGLWLAVTVYGLLSGISEGVERALVAELAPAGAKGTAFGWYYMVTGLTAIAAGVLFGTLWQVGGGSLAFGLAAATIAVCAIWLSRALGPAATVAAPAATTAANTRQRQ